MALAPNPAASVAVRAGRNLRHLNPSTVFEPPTAPAGKTFLPGPVLLLGAPGVGKGTQAQILMADFAIPQISTGDILRHNIASGTDLGLKAKSLIDKGILVDDQLVQTMVGKRLTGHEDVLTGFILDGFPRTLGQATWLDGFLLKLRQNAPGTELEGQGITLPVVAVNLVADYNELLHRITGRRTCPVCKSIYNIYSNPPKVAGRCDLEGAALIQRPDDTEPVFAERMKTFEAQTAPVIEYYRRQNRFREVKADLPLAEVTNSIVSALHDLRSPAKS